LDQRGVAAYVDAVAPITSDYERRRALSTLLSVRPLPSGAANLAVRSAADMQSDYDRSLVLRAAIETSGLDQADSLFAAVSRMTSSYEERRVLSDVIARGTLPVEMRRGVLAAAARIDSDY